MKKKKSQYLRIVLKYNGVKKINTPGPSYKM